MNVQKLLWILVGILSFLMGTIGIFFPILPTVPLYLLTSFAFMNCSNKLYLWFKHSYLYKKYLSQYLNAGGLTKKHKIHLILFVTAQISIAALLLYNSLIYILFLAVIYLVFLFSILFLVKTIKKNNKENL